MPHPQKRKAGSAKEPAFRYSSAATLTPKKYPPRRPSATAVRAARMFDAPLAPSPKGGRP